MAQIRLLIIFTMVVHSCADQKLSAISANKAHATEKCGSPNSAGLVPRQNYDFCNSQLKLCETSHSKAPQINQCAAESSTDGSRDNIESPRDWYDEFRKNKQKNVFSPSSAAALFRTLVVRRENGLVRPIRTDKDETWNETPLVTFNDQEIDNTLEAYPDEIKIENETVQSSDDTERLDAQTTSSPCEISFDSLAECFELDSFLDISGNEWVFYYYNRNTRTTTELKRAHHEPSNQYGHWIRQYLNFDGIILDIKKNHILAFVPEAEYFLGSQAITIPASDTKFILQASHYNSGGLLELTSKNNQFAIFKLPVKRSVPEYFKPGTKFLMQSNPVRRRH